MGVIVRLVFAPSFVADLNRIYKFISKTEPKAAKISAQRLKQAFDLLEEHPYLGYVLNHLGEEFREYLVPFGKGAYAIRYRVEKSNLYLLHVWHSRESR